MTWVDWAIVSVLAAATIGGISQGLLRSVCSLSGLIFGLLIAAWNYGRVAAVLQPAVRIEAVSNALGFLLIALVIMAFAHLVGVIISKMVHKIGLGCLDRLAGAVFGFVQGAVLVTLSILVVLAFFPKSLLLADAKLPKYFFGACQASTHLSPGELENRVHHGIDVIEERAPVWMHAPGSQI
jgi:membrane protein required for colicin V production